MKDGILLIDKPKGITSHDVIKKLRKVAKTKKIGHSGTLDPNATGLLVLFFGNATKLMSHVDENHKKYIADIRFGYETDTDDITGNIVKQEKIDFSKEDLETTLKDFIGTYDQYPPIYSARKVNGKKLYEYARKGQEVEIKPKEVTIDELTLTDDNYFPNEITVEIDCSKGTYIRSLARDIGRALNSAATMGDLRRTESGIFSIEDSFILDDLDSKESVEKAIIPINEAFTNLTTLSLKDEYIKDLENGKQLDFEAFIDPANVVKDELVLIKSQGKIKSFGFIKESRSNLVYQPKKVFVDN